MSLYACAWYTNLEIFYRFGPVLSRYGRDSSKDEFCGISPILLHSLHDHFYVHLHDNSRYEQGKSSCGVFVVYVYVYIRLITISDCGRRERD